MGVAKAIVTRAWRNGSLQYHPANILRHEIQWPSGKSGRYFLTDTSELYYHTLARQLLKVKGRYLVGFKVWASENRPNQCG